LPVVVKRNGEKVPYEREKIERSIVTAIRKARVEQGLIEQFLNGLERKFSSQMRKEVNTIEIGQEVLSFLRGRDQVAYVRFASAYGDFRTIDECKDLVTDMRGEKE